LAGSPPHGGAADAHADSGPHRGPRGLPHRGLIRRARVDPDADEHEQVFAGRDHLLGDRVKHALCDSELTGSPRDRLVALLQSLLVRHDPSGLYVLPAPVEPAFADQVSGADMVRIVKILQSFCAYVVIDTPAHFNDVVLALLEESDDILLISGMDIPNIKNVKLGLQTLRLLNIPVSKLKLVLNRSNSKVKLDIGEVERTLQMKADALIPSDILVPQSVNKGVPAVIDAPKSGVSRSLEQLASLFVDSSQRRARR